MSVDHERALLGAALQGYPDLPGLLRVVKPADFDTAAHGAVWHAVRTIHDRGDTPDAYLVLRELGERAHRLPDGATYLTDLAGDPALVTANAPTYAAQVREDAVGRHIDQLGQRARQMLTDGNDSTAVLGRIRQWLDAIDDHRPSEFTTTQAALEYAIDVAEHGEPLATPTPWPDLTDVVSGWFPNQLVVIGARPGVGKSIFLENAATDVAMRGKWVLWVSLEMSAGEIVQRTLAHVAKVELTPLRRGRGSLSEADWQRVNDASAQIAALPIRFADDGTQGMADIRRRAWQVAREARQAGGELALVVVDYLQLVDTPNDQNSTRQQRLGAVSRGLKRLAKELHVPVMAAAQLNRNAAQPDRPPGLSDIREAGDIEQDADVVILLHEQRYEDGGRLMFSGDLDVIVAKQRNGPQRTVTLRRSGHYAKITS